MVYQGIHYVLTGISIIQNLCPKCEDIIKKCSRWSKKRKIFGKSGFFLLVLVGDNLKKIVGSS